MAKTEIMNFSILKTNIDDNIIDFNNFCKNLFHMEDLFE